MATAPDTLTALIDSIDTHQLLVARLRDELAPQILRFATLVSETIRHGSTILLFGNGGSAADAQHFAAEIVGRFRRERPSWPAVALTTDSSILTAVGNDYGFERIFSRQVEGLARTGDLAIGISTSGNSPNVREGLLTAASKGCRTAALLGGDGGTIRELCDLALVVPSRETPRIQECHSLIVHLVCDLVETELCGGAEPRL